MAQYIKRSDATDALINNTSLEGGDIQEAVDAICSIPAADVRPVVRGKWSRIDYEPCGHDYKCSACGWKNDMSTFFCPNCGADMREVNDGA